MSDAIPFIQNNDVVPGKSELMLPGVRRVTAGNSGPFTFTGTGSYIIGCGEVAIIDPGPDDDDHINALLRAVDGERVSHILITHTHSDHCGGARSFADMVGAPIYGYGPHPVRTKEIDAPALDEGADYNFAPDELLRDGDIVEGSTWRLEAVHTPGHLSNHLCFALIDKNALFTGDHIMGWATTVVAPPDGDMGDYLASLDKLLTRDDNIYFPTHGAPIENPHRFVRAVKTHRLMRDAQIIDRLKAGKTTIKALVREIYADIDKRLHSAAGLNVYAHLLRLETMGKVVSSGENGLRACYKLAEKKP